MKKITKKISNKIIKISNVSRIKETIPRSVDETKLSLVSFSNEKLLEK